MPYEEALEKQLSIVQQRIEQKIPDTLIFNEHPPTYTLGNRKESPTHVLWDEAMIKQKGICIAKTNRGGDITYHGPGQLVGYVILDLNYKKDLHAYLRKLEEVLIHSLKQIGLDPVRRSGKTGIWIQNRKIAAIGIALRKWVTYHGFSLNINNDLTPFQGIVPCGIPSTEGSVTSLERELLHLPSWDTILNIIELEFWKAFSISIEHV